MTLLLSTNDCFWSTLWHSTPSKLPACTTASRTAVATMATNSSANLNFVWLNPSWWFWIRIMLQEQNYKNPNISWHLMRFYCIKKTVSVSCKVVQRMYTGNRSALCLGFPRHHTWVDNGNFDTIQFYCGQCHMVNTSLLDSDTDPCFPSVYYYNISSFQSWVTNYVDMTPTRHAGCVCI